MRPAVALLSSILIAAEVPHAPMPTYTAAEKRHWSFQPVTVAPTPSFTAPADRAWAQNPIDAFILERLLKDGLRPAPRADRITLIRRVTLDMTGLPPTPAEVDAFVADRAPDAWARVVDRLLASPAYGERWAQHWLDVVRFGETEGFEYDNHRPDAWRYRDYVVHSLNNDKPYPEFVKEQLAGDEMNPNHEQLRIAAGFQRLGAIRRNAGNQEVASSRNEVLTEMTNIVGSAFLGMTLGCARCHDHKFDAIKQSDYYRVQGYFASTFDQDIPLTPAADQAAWKKKFDEVEASLKKIESKMKLLKGDELVRMQSEYKAKEAELPEPLPSLFSVKNDPAKTSPIHLLARGEYELKGAAVGMRPPGILAGPDLPELPLGTENPRTKLADWMFNGNNPLPARVMANRLWSYHFGRGIVATPNDFGRMGARPTHRELLDYLADQYRGNGWHLKPLHRQILLSNTYQQAVTNPLSGKLAAEKDPDKSLLWAFPRKRLDAEQIRDGMLAVSGQLNAKLGGQSVLLPVQPELVNLLYKPHQWVATKDAAEHNRRSLYLIQKRNLRLPFMEVFDLPDRSASCARRESSTHAPQALELLNGDTSSRLAQALAARLRAEAGPTPAKQIDLAYRLATSRLPSAAEKQTALAFLRTQPLEEFALAILNLNAFLYVN
ncbi:MAG: DUF1549 and DUF1553 domain-containing protein [Bryobacteraceae bacterium]|nr:DUF1549 and DUF1553 domain-containing protein [Bryobacteraceae bacterium]